MEGGDALILWMSVLRTIFLYVFVLIMMRLMGKREIGKLSIFDLIVSFMIADITAMNLEDPTRPLVDGLVPIVTLVGLQLLLSIVLLKSRKARSYIDGNPAVIIKDGKILDSAMSKARYNLDDLLMQLREKNIPDVSDVEFAILETSGKLSVFPKTEKLPVEKGDILGLNEKLKPFKMPTPVIIEGKVQEKELKTLGLNHIWLKLELRKHGFKDFKDIYYASVDGNKRIFIDAQDHSPSPQT